MKGKSSLAFLFAVGLFAAFGSPAKADLVAVFYSGGSGYTGAFAGGGYSLTTGTSISTCSTGCTPVVGGDIINQSITFTNGITASTTSPAVWFDRSPSFGGLGLQTAAGPAGTGDDQIEGSGVLHLHFSSNVILTSIVTLFNPGHEDFNGGVSCGSTACTVPGTADFKFSLDGSTFNPLTFATANNTNNSFGGPGGSQDFYFMEDGTRNPEFYVSALTYRAVPGPVVGAGLPGLMFAGAGLLGWLRRRRSAVAV